MTVQIKGLQIGDLVEFITPLRGRALKVGSQGRIVLDDLPWGMCSVAFGSQLWQVHRRHLRKVEPLADGAA